ncbi:MAG TPA: PQQ-binding-like beta-propeller repeat protein, partial [Thermomicrobiales bacterium]|nr:PQQ-binding-like beta-propeller repeat protein [Thermomicrobiales bacterium]
DHKLYAFDLKTGQERWHFTTEAAVNSSPAFANGLVYVGSLDAHVYAIGESAATGITRSTPSAVDTELEEVGTPAVTTLRGAV